MKNHNRYKTSKKIGSVIKDIAPKKFRAGDFTIEFYNTFKEELTLMILKLF
jgi:hypothetical protein